jgi:FAD/FMN-containing dehydrogenase/Fe-S oxidoreductase
MMERAKYHTFLRTAQMKETITDVKRSMDPLDLKEAVHELQRIIQGDVRYDEGSLGLYTVDASNYRHIPIACVMPQSKDDIAQTIAWCQKYELPVLPRGGGTSLAGQSTNAAVVMDMTRYFQGVIAIDAEKKLAKVLPGTVLDDLRHEAQEKYELTFAPDPATHNHCTLGGMLGNNSCGVHSLMRGDHGRTSDSTHELEIITYDGERMHVGATSPAELDSIIRRGGRKGQIYRQLKSLRDHYANLIRQRYPLIPRRVSGYNLDELLPEKGFHVARALVGSEGTCVTVLEATLELVSYPREKVLAVIGFDSVYAAGDAIPAILEAQPMALEGLDDKLFSYSSKSHQYRKGLHLFPEGGGWLLAEFGGVSQDEAMEAARRLDRILTQLPHSTGCRYLKEQDQQKAVWEIRESGLGTTAFSQPLGETWPGWEDSAVPPDKFGLYLRKFRTLLNQYQYDGAVYGHFGQGCLHVRINFDLRSEHGRKKYKNFISDAADLVVNMGGSLSGEHGDGQSRGQLLTKMYGPELIKAFEEFKRIWDPLGRMNPGRVVQAPPADEHLKIGSDYHPKAIPTYFSYPEDHGSFSHAAVRCVGVGECRREKGGTMCPSYRVTHEEKHSTRGRAHLLHEMIDGSLIKDGFASEAVKSALDLCLACKGCKNDCPVQVDMATYKAEFLAHYHKHKRRPRQAYTMGLVHWWARLASQMPGLVNTVTATPGLKNVLKLAGGMSQHRDFPRFASVTFRDWFEQRQRKPEAGRPQVLLFPDTFNNAFHPYVGRAAAEVLEAAGYEVIIPNRVFCCGRPLYDYGMLDLARNVLTRTLEGLEPYIRKNIPIVGLEPSCLAVFRDELKNLFPKSERAHLLSQSCYTLAEFMTKKARDYRPPQLKEKAIVHGHCHHKAVMGFDRDAQLFMKLGLDLNILDSGCCGMAGSFGFEPGEKYEVSVGAGEKVLLPAVRRASRQTLIVADGFSCKEQIQQTTQRKALHTAEVMHMSLKQKEIIRRSGETPEESYYRVYGKLSTQAIRTKRRLAWGAGLTLALWGLHSIRKKRLGRRAGQVI